MSSDYTITPLTSTTQSITGTPTDRKWLGTHIIVIKGTNGVEDSSVDARGNNGLYNSVESAPLSLTIIDPCADSIVNSNAQFSIEEPFEVPLGNDKKDETQDGPSDSISHVYGNGFDICGPLSYKVYDASGLLLTNNF